MTRRNSTYRPYHLTIAQRKAITLANVRAGLQDPRDLDKYEDLQVV